LCVGFAYANGNGNGNGDANRNRNGNANSNGQTYSNSKRGSYTAAASDTRAPAVTLADSRWLSSAAGVERSRLRFFWHPCGPM
jgi:hypothetical protein